MSNTNFEDKLNKLETIVSKMDSGKLSLDDMIVAFEEGRKLVDECQKDLNSIRLKIEKVTASGAREPVGIKENGDVDL